MSTVTQEASEAMRQLQKLSKELNPVKTALSALRRRESATPSAEAAAASLEKIAARLESVCAKYRPFMARLDELTEQDLPQLFLQTPLLTAEDEALAQDIHLANHLAHEHHRQRSGMQDSNKDSHVSSHSSSNGDNGSNAASAPAGAEAAQKDGQDKAATLAESMPARSATTTAPSNRTTALPLLGEVCPANMPYALGAENYRLAHDQLRMRADMVDYLIDTGRLGLAEHVADAYKLPRLWFPRLHTRAGDAPGAEQGEEEEREVRGGQTAVAAEAAAKAATASPHSARLAATTNSLDTTSSHDGSPLSATLHRTANRAASVASSATPVRPTLPSTNATGAAPRSASRRSPSSSAPERPLTHHSPASPLPTTATTTRQFISPSAAHATPNSASSPPLGSAERRFISAASNPTTTTTSARMRSPGACATSNTRVSPLLSVLASRVVAAGMYLKDEYFDRLVLERFAELRGFSAPNTAIAAAPPSPLTNNSGEDGATSDGGRTAKKAWANETGQGRARHKHENKFRSFFNLGEIRTLLFGPSNSSSNNNNSSAQQQQQQQRSGNGVYNNNNNNGVTAAQPGPEDTERAYDTLLLNRVYHLPHSHLCTQSDSALFDRAMMDLVEELLAHALVRANEQQQQQPSSGAALAEQAAGQTSMSSARDDAAHAPPRKQRSVESDSAGNERKDPNASSSSSSSASLVRRHLTPLELLGAEDAFSNHTMVIKRPTRYYCMLTGSCMNDVTERAYPVALGSGAVVSHQALHHRALREAAGAGLGGTPKDTARSKAERTPLSQSVRRLFVT